MDKKLFSNPDNGRYYLLYLTKNLFDEWVLVCEWGSENRGQCGRKDFAVSYQEGLDKANEISRRRLKRGYKAEDLFLDTLN